jgi:alkanesulfonate monooxygenase SsuD/methylene tetrahydromethanopterin reductase-like flavin-dependent oxidoreductase (luciferase family)
VPTELEVFGAGSTEAPARVARLAESLTILRGLWSGDEVDHRGEHFTLVGAQQRPAPTRPIPITIGGVGRKTLALVREHADWWNVPMHEAQRLAELRDQVGDARVSIQTMVALVPDEASRAEVTELVERRFGRTGMGQNLVIGDVDELADHVAGLADGGVERVYVWFADFAPVATLERFGDVIAASP